MPVYGLISLMTIDLRGLGWITKATQFSGRGARCGTDFECLDEIIVPNEKINYANDCVQSGSPC